MRKTVDLKLVADYTPEPDPPEANAEFSLEFSNYSVSENTQFSFKIIRTVRVDQVLDVDWAFVNVSVLPVSGTQRFQIGETEKTITVTSQEVVTDELGSLVLSNPVYISGPLSEPLLGTPSTAVVTVFDVSSSSYPNLRNVSGWYQIGSLSRIFDEVDDPNYIIARATPYMVCQILTMASSSGRAAQFAKWESLKADNPLLHGVMHSKPIGAMPAHRTGTTSEGTYFYQMVRDRHNRDVGACMLDTDNAATQFNGNEPTGFIAEGGTVFTPNFVTEAVRDDCADIAADILTGSNLSGFGFGGGEDISDYMSWFHDSTNIQPFGYDKKLMNPVAVGQIVSVDSWGDSTGTHLRQCTINNQPGSGVQGKPIYFFPHNDAKGFIGYVISSTGYTEIGGGQATLELLPLPGTATGVSQLQPAANWRYTVSNPDSTPDNVVDWNADGIAEDKYEGAPIWVPAWLDIWARIETKMGKETAIGWNSTATSWDVKYKNGWPSPHEFTATCDNPSFENASRAFGFKHDDVANNYLVKFGLEKVERERGMGMMYWHKSLRKNPNSFVANKPYRPYFECLVVNSINDVTTYDANMMRFILALTLTIGDMSTGGVLDTNNRGVMIEEYFIDLDTNYSTVEPIADYDDAGGGLGESGYPLGSTTMRTPTCGEHIYARRVGNWLVIINWADSSRSNYPTLYAPSHLPGGYTPQAGNDEITSSDWATIIATYLQPGETLRHFNPATYVNNRVTTWLRSESPNHWGSGNPAGPFSYGPQQAHPNDGDGVYTLSTTPLIARDPTLNDGSVVNTNASYLFGPMQAVFMEIV
jgi:hypothetical protein